MKKGAFVFLAIACFVGVLAALQADRFLARRGTSPELSFSRGLVATPIDYASAPAGAVDFREPAKKVLPSVVSVDRYERIQRYFSEPELAETATGSGVIISADGTIVTNNHMVADPNGTPVTQVRVRLSDKRVFTAKVIGTDPRADLAVLKIQASGLTPIELGDSSKVEVGQWVMAVGNPLGYDGTVSVGVISNKSRSLPSENGGVLLNAIQTDAAINPGNSGGALTDTNGALVGINTAIISNTGTTIGIGFAIPVNKVKQIAQDIISTGHSRYGVMGFSPYPGFDDLLATAEGRQRLADTINVTNIPESGLVVPPARGPYGLDPSMPAAQAGIQALDIILSIDDKPLNDRISLYQALADKKSGDKIRVKYWSKGQTKTVTLTLAEEPLNT